MKNENSHGLSALADAASSSPGAKERKTASVTAVGASAPAATTSPSGQQLPTAVASTASLPASSLVGTAAQGGQQQWSQIIAAASAGLQAQVKPETAANTNLALLAGLQAQLPQQQTDPSALLVVQQQLKLYQYLMQQPTTQTGTPQLAAPTVTAAAPAPLAASSLSDRNKVLALSLAAGQIQQHSLPNGQPNVAAGIQILPSAQPQPTATATVPASASMPPPSAPIRVTSNGVPPPSTTTSSSAAVAPIVAHASDGSLDEKAYEAAYEAHVKGKKQQKRVANRRSAQLSRKRKKAFIEELKDENDSLRRKKQILMSVPDLIVVFDSAGKLWFVSESVRGFLNYTAKELEGTSFWDRLCEDSVRLLKAAFMDSLAARQPDSDTAPLGSGVWELRLVDKDGKHKIVTLNGVVHFAGERPECICSIRSGGVIATASAASDKAKLSKATSAEAQQTETQKIRHQVKPQQSVISSITSSDSSVHTSKRRSVGKVSNRISDSGNSSSGDSESGSSDELIDASS